jgi:hypothetical protein
MSKSRRMLFLVAAVATIVCTAVWMARRTGSPARSTAVVPSPQNASTKAAAVSIPIAPSLPPTSHAGLSTWSWDERRQAYLDNMLATRDPRKWRTAIGSLNNQHFKREEVIAVLTRLLDYPDPDVRMAVGDQLLQLGSYAGVPALQAILRLAARGELSAELADSASYTLHRYRQIIDPKDLYEAYQRFKTPTIIEIATLQQVPEMRDVILEWRETQQGYYDMDWMAAQFGMKDPDSIARYRWLTKGNDVRAEILGHWALYRALGQQSDLDYVISTARQVAGMEPTAEEKRHQRGSRQVAFNYLAATIEPRVTKVLEEIADHVAVHSDGGSALFSRAFTALFYLHKDDAFVNQRVMEFLRGQYRGPGVDRELLLSIAAVRRTPEIDAAALAFNPMAWEYALNRVEGRRPESWGGSISYEPITLVPPLPPVTSGKK